MRLTINKSALAFIGFLLVFPLDSIAYLGQVVGFALPVGFVGIVVAFISLLFIFKERGGRLFLLIFYSFIFFFLLLLVFLSWRSGGEDYYFWLRSIAFFYLGFLFFSWLSVPHGAVVNNFLLVLLFFLLVLSFSVDFHGINYLRLSDGALMLVFLILALLRSGYLLVVASIVALLTMYNLESRFSLAVLVVVLLVFAFLYLGVGWKLLISIFAPVVVFCIYQLGFYFYGVIESVHDNRLLRLIYSPGQDTSLGARDEMLLNAISILRDNYIFGVYKYYLDYGVGAYAHNFISYIAEFGLVGFLYSFLLLALLVFCLIKTMALDTPAKRFVFFCSIFVILGLLFAKSYNWSIIYFVFGLGLAFFSEKVNFGKSL